MILTIFVLRKLAVILDYCTDRLDNLESEVGSGRDEKFLNIIRIFLHECQVWIDKSVPRVTFWHHEACLVLPNCDPRDSLSIHTLHA